MSSLLKEIDSVLLLGLVMRLLAKAQVSLNLFWPYVSFFLLLPLLPFPSLETITTLLLIQILLKVISFLDCPRRMVLSLQKAHWNFCPCWSQELWRGLVSGVQIWGERSTRETLLVQQSGVLGALMNWNEKNRFLWCTYSIKISRSANWWWGSTYSNHWSHHRLLARLLKVSWRWYPGVLETLFYMILGPNEAHPHRGKVVHVCQLVERSQTVVNEQKRNYCSFISSMTKRTVTVCEVNRVVSLSHSCQIARWHTSNPIDYERAWKIRWLK